jgi:cation:H+ antiporter
MWLQGIYFVIGLLGLIFGAEWLVRGAASIASSLGVRPLVIGLTIVAIGTSAPELAVSVLAALDGRGDIAIGNVVGSNIANLGLILGLTALIQPLAMQRTVVMREIPVMITAALIAALMALDDQLTRLDGTILLVCCFAYLGFMLRTAQELPPIPLDQAVAGATTRPPLLKHAARVVVGLIVLVVSGRLLVNAAAAGASALGVSDLVIGMTVVAIGTSLPELATSVLAALRGHADLAVGNVIGSNILNIFAILGTTALVQPIAARPEIFNLEVPMMLGFSVALLPLAVRGMKLARLEGAILFATYVAFLTILVGRGTP